MDGIVYAYRNKINGKHYVGQTVSPERRKRSHLGAYSMSTAFNHAVKKYGRDTFEYSVLVDGIDNKQDLNEWERYFIWYLQSQKNGYNITSGGDGMDSETSRQYAKKRLESPQWRSKNKAHINKLMSDPSWRNGLSERNKSRAKTEAWQNNNKIAREKMYSHPDWQKKRIEAASRVKNNPEWRRKMKEIGQRNSESPTWRANNRESILRRSRLIYCIDAGLFFRGFNEAGRFAEIDGAGIALCCKGKRAVAGGHLWRLATQQEIEEHRGINE